MSSKIKCVIVDDEPAAHYVLADYIGKQSFLTLEHQMYNGLEAIKYLENNPVDLMFLDIDMPEISGIELLKTIPIKPKTILTTAYSEYALESYNYGVIDYLLKPIFYPRFLKAIAHFKEKTATVEPSNLEVVPDNITLKIGYEDVCIPLGDILFTQSYGNYVKIYTKTRTYVATITTIELEKKLPSCMFARAHKSHIVAFKKIKKVTNDTVVVGQIEIPIGITYKRAIMEKLEELQ